MVDDLCIRWRKWIWNVSWNVGDCEIYLLMYVSILRVISIDESVKNFQVLKKSSGHSRGILVVSCETWRWASLLVDGTRGFLWTIRPWQNDRLLGGWATRRWKLLDKCNILDDIKRFFSRRCPPNNNCHQKLWEIDMGFLLLSLLTFSVLFLGLFYALRWKTWRRR